MTGSVNTVSFILSSSLRVALEHTHVWSMLVWRCGTQRGCNASDVSYQSRHSQAARLAWLISAETAASVASVDVSADTVQADVGAEKLGSLPETQGQMPDTSHKMWWPTLLGESCARPG